MNDETDDMTAGMVTASCLFCAAVPMWAGLLCLAIWLLEKIP